MTEQLIALADAQQLTVNSPRNSSERGGTVCVDFPGSEAAHHELIARGYVIDWRPNCGVRISPHFYNTEGELEGIMAEIRKLRS